MLAIKSAEDGQVKFKARYVIGGHRDRMKALMAHSAATLQLQSIRLLLALAAVHGFDIWSSDVRQAYLQFTEPMSRELFITKPVPESELQSEHCLKLLKPRHGLCDSGDLWNKTLDEHHRHDLGMTPFRSDPALYKIMSNGLVMCISGGYVDALLRTGSPGFRQLATKTKERFQMGEDEHTPCTLSGFSLAHGKDGSLEQNQHFYLQKLERLHFHASFAEFRSMRMRLAWLANTRPNCQFEISQPAQVTEDRYLAEQPAIVRRLKRATRYATDRCVSLKIAALDQESLHVVGFADASFANSHDLRWTGCRRSLAIFASLLMATVAPCR